MDTTNYKAFANGDRVVLRDDKGQAHDVGTVLDSEPNHEGRILVCWTSGARSWAKLDCLYAPTQVLP